MTRKGGFGVLGPGQWRKYVSLNQKQPGGALDIGCKQSGIRFFLRKKNQVAEFFLLLWHWADDGFLLSVGVIRNDPGTETPRRAPTGPDAGTDPPPPQPPRTAPRRGARGVGGGPAAASACSSSATCAWWASGRPTTRWWVVRT